MDGGRLLELLVDALEIRVAPVRCAHAAHPLDPNVGEPRWVDRQADDLRRVDLEQLSRRFHAHHDRDVRHLVAEVAEVDRERRLGRARDADEYHVRLVEPADAVVVLDGELDRLDPPEVGVVERGAGARLHPRRDPGDPRDRVDRMAEQVAVVESRPAAELAHRVPQPWLYERVDHHRWPATGLCAGDLEVLYGLAARVPDHLERLARELRFEREHEPGCSLASRVRHDVELDRLSSVAHGGRLQGARRRQIAGLAIALVSAAVKATRSAGASSISSPRRPPLT